MAIEIRESNPVIPSQPAAGRCMPTPTQSPLSEQAATPGRHGDAMGRQKRWDFPHGNMVKDGETWWILVDFGGFWWIFVGQNLESLK